MSDLPHDPADDAREDGDGMGAARGIVLGLELAGLLWVAVALAVWAWLRWHGGV